MVLYFIYALNFLVFFTLRVASPAFISTAYPIELNYFINIFIFISTYTFVRFAISFVNDKKIPENKYITGIINVLFGATLLVSLFPSQEANSFFFAIKLSFFVGSILYLIWYLLTHIKDNVLARIYIVMAMPLILSGMVEGLTNVFGVLKVPNQFFEAFRMSICLEMLFILFALIYREQYLGKIIQNQLKATEFKLLNTQIEIQEAEEERIAKDLHDDLGGTLSTLKRFIFDKLISKATENEKNIIKKLTQKAGDDLRRISHALLPPEINVIGLTETLKELVSRNDGERSFKFIQHGKIKKLDENTEINIYRIVSEIIQNINKHSSANKVLIQMLWSEEELTIMVEDNGSQFRNTKEGLGLKNIRMRTEYINGMINFDSNDTESTIILEIPIKNEKQDTHS
jgi:signal transduction histidine kinase